MQYLDFDVEIGQGQGRDYPVTVFSPAGEAHATLHFPFDEIALESRLKDLQIALLRSGGQHRRVSSPEEFAVQDFGQRLFEALFTGEVRSRYAVTRQEAVERNQGVRLRLRILAPELAALPWEFLYDAQQDEYLSLSRQTPLVRYLDLPQPLQPLQIELPLRILGMIASPSDQIPLDIAREQGRMQSALQDLEEQSLIKLTWVGGQTWRDLQHALQGGPWHIFHFIGHGGYNPTHEEGVVAFANESGQTHLLSATELGRLLANHPSLRLVVLNACEGAKGGERDLFSSTAAILARKGIPAVLAMQYEITDRAAIECTRAFYEALAGGLAVDEALAEARTAISLGVANTLEWGTPVLYLRASDGRLFLPPTQTTARPVQTAAMPFPLPREEGIPGKSSPPKAAGVSLGEQTPLQPPAAVSPRTGISAPPAPGSVPGPQAGQSAQSAHWLPGPSPVGEAPATPTPGAPPWKGRAGLIAWVSVLLVIVVTVSSLTALGANHQGPLALLFGGGSSPTPTAIPTFTSTPGAHRTFSTFAGPTPSYLTIGPDHAIWFTETSADKIARMTVEGHVTHEYLLPTSGALPEGIVTGLDGNLWFSEGGASVNSIGRMTPGGTFSAFPISSPNSYVRSLAVGADGNLWFTEEGTGKVGKITVSGIITEFMIRAGAFISGIAKGSDGNIWFTEGLSNYLGRITPTGVVAEFGVTCPDDITPRPDRDGNLWFREGCGRNVIGKVTPDGTITEYPFPGTSSPGGITVGSDGNIWFMSSYQDGDRLGQSTLSGQITETVLTNHPTFGPGLLSGPDGNLWFPIGNGIGRFVP